jgi:hypothetical protein
MVVFPPKMTLGFAISALSLSLSLSLHVSLSMDYGERLPAAAVMVV